MIGKKEIDLIIGQDLRKIELEQYRHWLIGKQGIGQDEAYNFTRYVGKLLRDNRVAILDNNEVWRLVSAIRCSNYSKSYQRHLLTTLENYLEFKGIKNEQGCRFKFEKPRATARNPKYLSPEEIMAFVRGARDYRELAMAILFLTTGIRLSELRNLNLGDVDLSNKVIKVRHGKRDKDREVPISDDTVRALTAYYTAHNLHMASLDEPLFRSGRGNRWSQRAVQIAVSRIGKNAGLKQNVTPHMLRHSFATHQISNGCDINSLRELLGHSDITTTSIYLHLNSSVKRQAYERGVPRF